MSTELNTGIVTDLGILRFSGGADRGVCYMLYDSSTGRELVFTEKQLLGIVNNFEFPKTEECFIFVDRDGDVWGYNEKANCWELVRLGETHYDFIYETESAAAAGGKVTEFEGWTANGFLDMDRLERNFSD